MKNLLIMRHAKSSWKHKDLTDIDRPLNKRGKKDAPLIGKQLLDRELVPEYILCSSAVRSRMTAEAIIEKTKFKGEVKYHATLYMAEPEAILEVIQDLPDEVTRAMVIGHNPGLEGFVQQLTHKIDSLPTGCFVYISLPIPSWKELKQGTPAEVIEYWKPRDLAKKSKK